MSGLNGAEYRQQRHQAMLPPDVIQFPIVGMMNPAGGSVVRTHKGASAIAGHEEHLVPKIKAVKF